MFSDNQEGVIAHSFSVDIGRRGFAPFAQRIAADFVRKCQPAFNHFFIFVFLIEIFHFLKKSVNHIAFNNEFVI